MWNEDLIASKEGEGGLYQTDALSFVSRLPEGCISLVYVDPPWNTGSTQALHKGRYTDRVQDYASFLRPVLTQLHRLLTPSGSLFLHLSPHESHYAKVWLDEIFGRENFRNEIIWLSELGRYGTSTWGWKHSTLLWFTKSDEYVFHREAIPMTLRKAKRPGYEGDKPWVDVWTHTMSNSSGERTGYPSQKPLAILNPIVGVHSNVGDLCLDCFCGSGSFGEACVLQGRRAVLADINPDAIDVTKRRLGWT